MPEIDGPELHVIEFPAGAGEELRAQAERHRAEARTRYLAHLSQHLSEADAAIALDALTVWNNVTSGDRCACSCHPHLAQGDLHDYGFDCPSRQTPDTRRRRWDEWIAERDAFWAWPESEQITAEREAPLGAPLLHRDALGLGPLAQRGLLVRGQAQCHRHALGRSV